MWPSSSGVGCWWKSFEMGSCRCHLWSAQDWRRVGELCPSVDIGPAFGRSFIIDDHLLHGGYRARERLFEKDLVGIEGYLEYRLNLLMKAQVCSEKNSHQFVMDKSLHK